MEPRKIGIWFNLNLEFISERMIANALAGCRYFQVTEIYLFYLWALTTSDGGTGIFFFPGHFLEGKTVPGCVWIWEWGDGQEGIAGGML